MNMKYVISTFGVAVLGAVVALLLKLGGIEANQQRIMETQAILVQEVRMQGVPSRAEFQYLFGQVDTLKAIHFRRGEL